MTRNRVFLGGAVLAALGLVAILASQRQAMVVVQPPAPVASPASADGPSIELERQGLKMSFSLHDVVEQDAGLWARAELRVTDSDGRPATGLRPLGFVFPADADEDPSEDDTCRRHLASFSQGLLSKRPTADLGAYLLVTMNDDNSLSVINPQLAFSRTKLEHMVMLQGIPGAWALHPSGDELFVSLPDQGLVAVVDTRRFLVVANLPVGSRPGHLLLTNGGASLWVAHDDGALSVVDVATRTVVATQALGSPGPSGNGPHTLVATPDGVVWASSHKGLVLLDGATHEILARKAHGAGSTLAYSPTAHAVYVAAEGSLFAFDGRSGEVRQQHAAPVGIDELAFDPSGRWLFAVRPAHGDVHIYDASALAQEPRVLHAVEPHAPVFTQGFAYVQDAASADVQLVDLTALEGGGELRVVRVPLSQQRPGRILDGVATPEGQGVIFARPEDKTLYYYAEGMMAPLGSFRTYGRRPHRLLVLDRTLREREPGVYATNTQLSGDGDLVVGVRLLPSGLSVCQAYPLGVRRTQAPSPAWTVALDDPEPLDPGEANTVGFHLAGDPPVAPMVHAVVFRTPGTWQSRPAVRPLASGGYSLEVSPPSAGHYMLHVEVRAEGRSSRQSVPLKVGSPETRVSEAGRAR